MLSLPLQWGCCAVPVLRRPREAANVASSLLNLPRLLRVCYVYKTFPITKSKDYRKTDAITYYLRDPAIKKKRGNPVTPFPRSRTAEIGTAGATNSIIKREKECPSSSNDARRNGATGLPVYAKASKTVPTTGGQSTIFRVPLFVTS